MREDRMTIGEALDWLEARKEHYELDDDCQPLAEALGMAIKALEQEPKTGHWIMTNDYFTGAYTSLDYVKCSCCRADSLEEGNFCPNCGAKMEEVEE
jgi:hypothetical protein